MFLRSEGSCSCLLAQMSSSIGLKNHWAVSDYLQRSARHISSKTDLDQAYAVGKKAVEFALAGKNAVMPVIKRLSNKPYKWKIESAPLSKVANVEKNWTHLNCKCSKVSLHPQRLYLKRWFHDIENLLAHLLLHSRNLL